MFPTIISDKILLREIAESDADSLFSYLSDVEMMKYTSSTVHSSINDTQMLVRKLRSSFYEKKGVAWIVEEVENSCVIGNIGLFYVSADSRKAGIGFNISTSYSNKGYATNALAKILQYGIMELGLIRIEATCRIENIASARVMEKAGMAFEGVLRNYSRKEERYYDVKMFSYVSPTPFCLL